MDAVSQRQQFESLLFVLIQYSRKQEQAHPLNLTRKLDCCWGMVQKWCMQQVPLDDITGVWTDKGKVAGLFSPGQASGCAHQLERKEKTMPLGLIQEKLMVKPNAHQLHEQAATADRVS